MLDITSTNGNAKISELTFLNCTPQTLTKFVFFLTLALCCWTHPRYHDAKLAKLLRIPVTIISAIWWLCYPFVLISRPLETNFGINLGRYAIGYIFLTKSVDWGLFSGPQPRRKFVKKNFKPVSGTWQVAEDKGVSTLGRIGDLLGHIFLQLTSMRGLQYPWGHFSQINSNSLKVDLSRFIIFQAYSFLVIGTLVNRESFSSGKIHEVSTFFGLNFNTQVSILDQWKRTFIIVTGLCATFESLQSFLAVLAHLLHPQLIRFGFPDQICDFFDPIYYPPLFGNPLEINSLSEFWGKTWHQVLRRSFIVLGAFPLAGLSAVLGFSPKNQRTMGFVGAFIASAILHAGSFFLLADTSTPSGNVPLREKFAVFFCFFIQAVGCLIENRVIRMIPKWLGGGKLWTFGFLLCTLPLFAQVATKPGRFVIIFDPVEKWGFFHGVIPIVITPAVL